MTVTKRILALFLAVAAVFVFRATAYASQEPDLEQPGSITLTLEWEGEPLNGGSFVLYPVGVFEKQGADYAFALLPELAEHSLTLENGLDAETAAAIAAVVETLKLEGHSTAIAEGKAFFGELKPGLFLVVQQEPVPGFCADSTSSGPCSGATSPTSSWVWPSTSRATATPPSS